MGKLLRIALVGAGGIANEHIKAIAPMPDVEFVGICDPVAAHIEARLQTLAAVRPNDSPEAFDDPGKMVASLRPDVVYILLPPFAHGPAEQACLAHSVPFFIEKPIGLDRGLTQEIAREVERTGLLTCAGYMNRYRAGVNAAREVLRSDPAVLVYGGWIGGSPNPQPGQTNIGSWWVQKEKSGGQLVEQCTHTFDLLRYLCGEAVEVHAVGARGFNVGLYNYTIEDASVVNIRLKSGGVANLFACCAANGGGGGVSLSLYAHDHTCLFTGWEHSVRILAKGSDPVEIRGEEGIFAIEDAVFLEAVRTGSPAAIRSNYADALRTLELTLAANESMVTGRPVPIADV